MPKIAFMGGFVRAAVAQVLVAIGLLWMFCGDSETEGRAEPEGTPCENPGNAFLLAINENEGAGVSSYVNLGLGRSSLNDTNGRYMASGSRTNRTLVWTQESGNQIGDGGSQDTAAEFKAVLKAHFIDVDTESPNAVQGYSYPFSFGRQLDAGRNWDTDYEDALEEAVAEVLAENGITVYLARDRQFIEALENWTNGTITIVPSDVWYTDDQSPLYAHYTPFGNAALAFTRLIALGRDPRTWTFTSWTDVTANQITALKAVAGGFI